MMNAYVLAEDMMSLLGGRKTKLRREMFRRLAQAIISHIRIYGDVYTVTTGVAGGGGSAPGRGKVT